MEAELSVLRVRQVVPRNKRNQLLLVAWHDQDTGTPFKRIARDCVTRHVVPSNTRGCLLVGKGRRGMEYSGCLYRSQHLANIIGSLRLQDCIKPQKRQMEMNRRLQSCSA